MGEPVTPTYESEFRQYLVVTGNYWTFTLTDGALRMLVVLHFYGLGFSPLNIALLFVFYEMFGVITNLLGGWFGARVGLNRTMNLGLGLQVLALGMLVVPDNWLTVPYVMLAQALSGIAKDLNKTSAKSAIRILVPDNVNNRLFRWVAFLTGSKNALKGLGFFLGGMLLTAFGFSLALGLMATALGIVWLSSLFLLRKDLGRTSSKPKFLDIFSKSRAVNLLSAARLFLFGARDVWFVVALPVYLSAELGWDYTMVGAYLALWVVGYGVVQALTPSIPSLRSTRVSEGQKVTLWTCLLSAVPITIAAALDFGLEAESTITIGLLVFGVVFAINSALHSFLIVNFADAGGVSLDVGFYYMANALGRLVGTVLSGAVYQSLGLSACLVVSSLFLVVAVLITRQLD